MWRVVSAATSRSAEICLRRTTMPYPIEDKLVIAIASTALFDLAESDRIFRENGIDEYRQHQRRNEAVSFAPGVAFPFVRRLLSLNANVTTASVEVVLLSHNVPDTGLRVFNSIKHHGLDISRGAFLSGKAPHAYMESFNASLLLSGNAANVRAAIAAGHAAGLVLGAPFEDDFSDNELRIAFDFDAVLADDSAEVVFHETGDIGAFHAAEVAQAGIPHRPGPLHRLFHGLAALQSKVPVSERTGPSVRIAVITARNAPSHERVVTTFRNWKVQPDGTFFLGGIEKARILKAFKPHMFFDDQLAHLESGSAYGAMVHVPFGIKNQATGSVALNRPLQPASEAASASQPEPIVGALAAEPCRIREAMAERAGERSSCHCCEAGLPLTGPRQCPECRHVFRGNGWDGIDAHWRAKHESLVTYGEFWSSLCDRHRKDTRE
jgi:5'-nucleotidase